MVQIADHWKSKGGVTDSRIKAFNSFQRIFEPANNVDRKQEDGCMKKIKIERSLKLKAEEVKNRNRYDIISGKTDTDQQWIKAFGDQAVQAKLVEKPKVASLDEMKSHWSKAISLKSQVKATGPIV